VRRIRTREKEVVRSGQNKYYIETRVKERIDMKNVTAKDIMTKPVVSARKYASARDIALQIFSGLYSGMPVTDEDGKVIGVVTEYDLLAQVGKGRQLVKLTAEAIMTSKTVTVDVKTPVNEVLNIMMDKDVNRVPVTENGRLVGIISRSDILKNYVETDFVTYS
jgi:CBS domain-containing protein